MSKQFKQGQLVKSKYNHVLVTGPGDDDIGYRTFAGVIITPDSDFGVGFYSDTWAADVFEETDIDISKLIN